MVEIGTEAGAAAAACHEFSDGRLDIGNTRAGLDRNANQRHGGANGGYVYVRLVGTADPHQKECWPLAAFGQDVDSVVNALEHFGIASQRKARVCIV